MRILFVTIIVLIQCGLLSAQDGSDMNYVNPESLDQSFVGRKLHLDFGQRSFTVSGYKENRPLDIVTIKIAGKNVKFIEHRVDDGYNNWFSRQYLESVNEIEGLKLRITEFELLKVNDKKYFGKRILRFFDKNGKILPEKSFTKDLSFEKKRLSNICLRLKINNFIFQK